jgi:hypothetical protein
MSKPGKAPITKGVLGDGRGKGIKGVELSPAKKLSVMMKPVKKPTLRKGSVAPVKVEKPLGYEK